MNMIKIINRDIIKTIKYKGKTYGKDINGKIYKKTLTTIKDKNGENELVYKWYRAKWNSWNRVNVLEAFKNQK